MLIDFFTIQLIATAAAAITVWIITMELVVARFLSKERNEKREWELRYWYE
jgi:hypothetical protein